MKFREGIATATGGSFQKHRFDANSKLNPNEWYWGEGYDEQTNPGLFEFFCLSDLDGEISPEMCEVIANELEKLLPEIAEADKSDEGLLSVTEKFIKGCRAAASANETLEFLN